MRAMKSGVMSEIVVTDNDDKIAIVLVIMIRTVDKKVHLEMVCDCISLFRAITVGIGVAGPRGRGRWKGSWQR